jgi:dTDP-4-amino-4,6-dideoxygalactose transaminase
MTIDLFRPFMAKEAAAAVTATLTPDPSTGRLYIGEGPRADAFEAAFAAFVHAPHEVVLTNSCTSALDLAAQLCGVGMGSEVITTPMTCTATNGVLANRGARLVWADVDPRTGLIDPLDVARKITRKTKAIMAVDWAGRSCDYAALRLYAQHARHGSLVEVNGVPIIQDAAHHLGVDLSQPHGDYVCWSFQAIKHLTTGDGGALLTPEQQTDRARLLRWYGLDRRSSADFRCAQDITEVGFKYHMNDIAATIGLANLPHAAWVIDRHRANAAWYAKAFAELRSFDPAPVILPPEGPADNSWWLYTLLVSDRDEFIARLAERGIAASPVHRRNDGHTAFSYPSTLKRGCGVDYFASHEVAIPVGWWLSDRDREQVAGAVLEWAIARSREAVAA